MLRIAIDGACRRNGKPNCVAASGVFVQEYDSNLNIISTLVMSDYEVGSTNQRGELLALLQALRYVNDRGLCATIITDSEYLFNTMTKEWFRSWQNKGWLTSLNEPVKNKDLWQLISKVYYDCVDLDLDVTFYHIKGHCIPFGKVTANTLLSKNDGAASLLAEVLLKYDAVCKTTKADALDNANRLSERNNGFELSPETLRGFVVANVVADAVATKCVDAADALM